MTKSPLWALIWMNESNWFWKVADVHECLPRECSFPLISAILAGSNMDPLLGERRARSTGPSGWRKVDPLDFESAVRHTNGGPLAHRPSSSISSTREGDGFHLSSQESGWGGPDGAAPCDRVGYAGPVRGLRRFGVSRSRS